MTSAVQIVRVADGQAVPYEIQIGAGLLSRAAELIATALGDLPRSVHIVSDTTLAPLYAPAVRESLESAGAKVFLHTIPLGESEKSWQRLEALTDAILANGIERSDALIALGGGVVGDITGLAGALLLRGVSVVQVPTSVLAQVDSSVGGKTAIDTRHGKNLIGAFYSPRLVLCDLSVLSSLPVRELRCGFAEIIKYGLAFDADFFAWLEDKAAILSNPKDSAFAEVLGVAVQKSCQHKARIVADDARDTTGKRALLNLGHTFAHALETTLGHDSQALKHGEAVGLGLVLAARLSESLGMAQAIAEPVMRLNQRLGLPVALSDIGLDASHHDKIVQAMRYDKKTTGGEIHFVLLQAIGQAVFPCTAEQQAVREVLA